MLLVSAILGAGALLIGGVVLSGPAPAESTCPQKALPTLFDYSSGEVVEFNGSTLASGTVRDAVITDGGAVIAGPGLVGTWSTPKVTGGDGIWGDVRLRGQRLDNISVEALLGGDAGRSIELQRQLPPEDNSLLEASTTTADNTVDEVRFALPPKTTTDSLVLQVALDGDAELTSVQITHGLDPLTSGGTLTVEKGWSGPILRLIGPDSREFSGYLGLVASSNVDFARVATGQDTHVVLDRTQVVQTFGNSVTARQLDIWLDAELADSERASTGSVTTGSATAGSTGPQATGSVTGGGEAGRSGTGAVGPIGFEQTAENSEYLESTMVEPTIVDPEPGGPAPSRVAIDDGRNTDVTESESLVGKVDGTVPGGIQAAPGESIMSLEWRCGPGDAWAEPFTIRMKDL